MNIWKKYANVLVDYSTEVKKGDHVVIFSDIQARPLILAVYEEVIKRGACPILRVEVEGQSELYYKYATDEQFSYIDPFKRLEYEKADKIISIGAPYNLKNMAKVPPEKMAKRSSATQPLMETMLSRAAEGSLSWVICDFPTNALAQEAKMSIYDYEEFLLKSCYLHLDDPVAKWKEIGKTQDVLVEKLDKIKQLHVVGYKTDITLSVEGRKWKSCCGLNNFPDGEVFTSPIENSAEGEVYFDFPAIYRGNESHGIYLRFEKGKVVHATAEKGEEFFLKMINQDEGARYLGEFAFGTNDMIQDVTGNILFDEKIGGSIHMALGSSYPETGGKNKSGLHWDIIKNMKKDSKVYADGNLIYENGKFLV